MRPKEDGHLREVVNGLANELAAESPPSKTEELWSSRVKEPRQHLLPQQRLAVLDLHRSSRQFLSQKSALFFL